MSDLVPTLPPDPDPRRGLLPRKRKRPASPVPSRPTKRPRSRPHPRTLGDAVECDDGVGILVARDPRSWTLAVFDSDQSLQVDTRELSTVAAPVWRVGPWTVEVPFRFVADPRVIPTDHTTLMHPSILRRLMVESQTHWIQKYREARLVPVVTAYTRLAKPIVTARIEIHLAIHPEIQDPRPWAGLEQVEAFTRMRAELAPAFQPQTHYHRTWKQRVDAWPTPAHATPTWSLGRASQVLSDDADLAIESVWPTMRTRWVRELRPHTRVWRFQWHTLSVMARRDTRSVSAATSVTLPSLDHPVVMTPLVPGGARDPSGCVQPGRVWSALVAPIQGGGILALHRGMGTTWLMLLHLWHRHPRAWILCPAHRIASWQQTHDQLFRGARRLGFPDDGCPWTLTSYEWLGTLDATERVRVASSMDACVVADRLDEASPSVTRWLLAHPPTPVRWAVVGPTPTRFTPWVILLHWIGVTGAGEPSVRAAAQVADSDPPPLALEELGVDRDPARLPDLPPLCETVRVTRTRHTAQWSAVPVSSEPWRQSLESLALVHAAMQHVVVRYHASDVVRRRWWIPPLVLETRVSPPAPPDGKTAGVRVWAWAWAWAWLERLRTLQWRAALRAGSAVPCVPLLYQRIVEQCKAEAGEIPLPLLRLQEWKQHEQAERQWRRRYVAPSDLRAFAEEQCMICTEVYTDPRILSCAHVFCRSCIRQWFANVRNCPACKRPHPERGRLVRVHSATHAEDDRWFAQILDAYRTIPAEAQSSFRIRESRIDALVAWVEAHPGSSPGPVLVLAYDATLLREADVALTLVPGHQVTLLRYGELRSVCDTRLYLLQAPRSPRVWWQLQRAMPCIWRLPKERRDAVPEVMHGYPAWATTEWRLARVTWGVWQTLRSYTLQWDDEAWRGWMDSLMQRTVWWTRREVEQWMQG